MNRMLRQLREGPRGAHQAPARAAATLAAALLVGTLCASATAAPPPPSFDTVARMRDSGERPSNSKKRHCSTRVSGCVHASAKVPDSSVALAVQALDSGLEALSLFGLPTPLPDGQRGGGPAFDIYLSAEVVGGAGYADGPPLPHDFDRRSAFGVVSTAPGPRCAIASRVIRAVAQGAALGLDSATHDAVLSMHGSYLAHLLHPCLAIEAAALDDFQRQPWRSLLSARREDMSGAFLFPAFLDNDWGTGVPAMVMTAAIAASVQRTDLHSVWWRNEPDLLDTLRANMQLRQLTLADLLSAFSVNRGFVGDRSDGLHLPNTEHFGRFGRVRFEWALDFASLPRQVAPLHPVEPTGSSYIWLDLRDAKADGELLLDIHWEDTFVMQWAAVRLDQHGIELGRLLTGGVFGHNQTQLTVANLTGAAAVIIVGTNLGHDDRSQPYDPEDGPPRPVGYTISIHAR